MIRSLGPGEPVPEGEPGRYRNAEGYVRLRWKTADGHVECYEHRLVAGLPPAGVEVHHRNHVRDDNRPENLDVLTPAEHGAEHRTLDDEAICREYEQGLSAAAVARLFGTDAGNVWRALTRNGIEIRPGKEYNRKNIPEWVIRHLYDRGMTARGMASKLGVSQWLISERFKEYGLQPRKRGRPRKR